MTEKATYTPGPWMFRRKHPTSPYAGTRILGPLNSLGCRDVIADLDYQDGVEANARLLAAAPELLEALEGIIGFADVALAKPELVGGRGAIMNLRGPAFDDARRVIAKARGTKCDHRTNNPALDPDVGRRSPQQD